MPQKQSKKTRSKPLSHHDVMADRKLKKAALKKAESTEAKKASLVNNKRLHQLFQSRPRVESTYNGNGEHKNRSFTDSLESYQYGADKERKILQRYGREPTKAIVLHFLREHAAEGINIIRKHIFQYLRKKGIEAVASIELTREKPRIGKPNNLVHFHILTDDPRSEDELRALFNTACEPYSFAGHKDFRVDYEEINDGYWYFEYFTKYDRNFKGKADVEVHIEALKKAKGTKKNKDLDEAVEKAKDWDWTTVVLFGKHVCLQKFYQIGKWFKKGRGKGQIWKEIDKGRKKAKDTTGEK